MCLDVADAWTQHYSVCTFPFVPCNSHPLSYSISKAFALAPWSKCLKIIQCIIYRHMSAPSFIQGCMTIFYSLPELVWCHSTISQIVTLSFPLYKSNSCSAKVCSPVSTWPHCDLDECTVRVPEQSSGQ